MIRTCPICMGHETLIVDGKFMSEETLLALSFAPKTIVREMHHKLWCNSEQNILENMFH
jgi:hypothetical protein